MMKQFKNGIFCDVCGNLVEVSETADTLQCKTCDNKVSLLDIEFDNFVEELVLPRKPWAIKYYTDINKHEESAKHHQTIEQRCVSENCDSNLCYYTSRQMRSADEGETIFYQCVKCHTRFTLNN